MNVEFNDSDFKTFFRGGEESDGTIKSIFLYSIYVKGDQDIPGVPVNNSNFFKRWCWEQGLVHSFNPFVILLLCQHLSKSH